MDTAPIHFENVAAMARWCMQHADEPREIDLSEAEIQQLERLADSLEAGEKP